MKKILEVIIVSLRILALMALFLTPIIYLLNLGMKRNQVEWQKEYEICTTGWNRSCFYTDSISWFNDSCVETKEEIRICGGFIIKDDKTPPKK